MLFTTKQKFEYYKKRVDDKSLTQAQRDYAFKKAGYFSNIIYNRDLKKDPFMKLCNKYNDMDEMKFNSVSLYTTKKIGSSDNNSKKWNKEFEKNLKKYKTDTVFKNNIDKNYKFGS